MRVSVTSAPAALAAAAARSSATGEVSAPVTVHPCWASHDVPALTAPEVQRGARSQPLNLLDESVVDVAAEPLGLAEHLVPLGGAAEVVHRVPGVLGHQVPVDGRTRHEPGPGGDDDLRHRVGHVPGGPHPRHRGRPRGVDREVTAEHRARDHQLSRFQAETPRQAGDRVQPGRDDDRLRRHELAVLQPQPGDRVVHDLHRRCPSAHHPDPAGGQPGEHLGSRLVHVTVQQQRHVLAELAEQPRLVRGHRAGAQDHELLPADLPAVAERAVQHVAAPALRETGHVGEHVAQPGGDQQPAGEGGGAVGQGDGEAVVGALDGGDGALVHLHPVAAGLGAAVGEQLPRRDPLAAEVVVGVRGGGVAGLPRVDDQHRAQRAPQRHRPGQPGGASPDHHHVVTHVHGHRLITSPSHDASITPGPTNQQHSLPVWQHDGVDDGTEAVLHGVGPRLRALRQRREVTLAELSATTGISVSTLSRLESGQRRATLELLLPLARAHQVPLDDLVGAPETGDPRVHLRPVSRHGMTVVPLSSRAGGLQAHKLVLPGRPDAPVPELRVHTGYEWLYVLEGRLRLVLGERDLVLVPGEAAEFDTRTPHWLGNADTVHPVEILALFGKQGERAHLRLAPRPPGSSA